MRGRTLAKPFDDRFRASNMSVRMSLMGRERELAADESGHSACADPRPRWRSSRTTGIRSRPVAHRGKAWAVHIVPDWSRHLPQRSLGRPRPDVVRPAPMGRKQRSSPRSHLRFQTMNRDPAIACFKFPLDPTDSPTAAAGRPSPPSRRNAARPQSMVLDGPPIAVTLPKNLSHSPRARPAVRAALADAKRNSVTPDIGHRQPAAETPNSYPEHRRRISEVRLCCFFHRRRYPPYRRR